MWQLVLKIQVNAGCVTTECLNKYATFVIITRTDDVFMLFPTI